MVDRKKLVAGATAAAVLILGVGTAVAAQQGSLPGQDEPATTGTVMAPQENEADDSESEAGEEKDSEGSLTGLSARRVGDAPRAAAPCSRSSRATTQTRPMRPRSAKPTAASLR